MSNINNCQQNFYLIGFMGSGKSSVSAYLSQQLALAEIEMDQLIVQREGMSITELFTVKGEDYFRSCETSLLKELQEQQKIIVSCGGGVVLRRENTALMKKHGRIIYLTASPETIYARVKDSRERPLLNDHMNIPYITQLIEKRQEYYLQAADIVLDTDGKTVKQICDEFIWQSAAPKKDICS